MAITTSYSWLQQPGTLLNTGNISGNQSAPAVAGALGGNAFFAAWTDPANANQVRGRVLTAEQVAVLGEFTVNQTANGGTSQLDPSVVVLSNGNFLVTYTDFAADPGGDIRGRLYDASGNALGADFAINEHNLFDDTQSAVAALSNGGFVVTYTRGFGGNIGIRAHVFDMNGTQVTSSIIVHADSDQVGSSVAGLASGGFVVTWQDDSSNEVYFRRYQGDGTALDADRVLIDTAGSLNRDIHVVGLADGGFAVAYNDNGWAIDGTEITFRIYNADGSVRTNFIRANDVDFGGNETGNQIWPAITTMGDLIVVGWVNADNDVSYVQVFDAQGNAVGNNTPFSAHVRQLELAGLDGDQVVNVYQSATEEAAGTGDSIRSEVSQFMRTQTGDGDDNIIASVGDGLRERLIGGAGDDVLKGGGGIDDLWGGSGNDTVSYENASAGVTASLSDESVNTGNAAGDDYSSVENLSGTDFNDTLIGDLGDNILMGGGGNDMLSDGGDGNDTLVGGEGDDIAAFALNFNAYTVQDFGANILVTRQDGTSIVVSEVEHLQFADTTITPATMANDGDPLFDTLYYLSRNADVFQAGANALEHYNTFGWHEGRDPNGYFDSSGYLAVNWDVAQAGMNPLEHYRHHGVQDGRDPSAMFDTELYLIHNPGVAASGTNPLAHFLQQGWSEGLDNIPAVGRAIVGGFDSQYYLFHNPDVAAAGVDPLQHFNEFGRHEGRDPNAWFDTAGYLSHYADVAAAGVNPLEHYMQFGWAEGRDPSAGFDTLGYLAMNPDVAAAGTNALEHYLQFGVYEGRQIVNDGVWH